MLTVWSRVGSFSSTASTVNYKMESFSLRNYLLLRALQLKFDTLKTVVSNTFPLLWALMNLVPFSGFAPLAFGTGFQDGGAKVHVHVRTRAQQGYFVLYPGNS